MKYKKKLFMITKTRINICYTCKTRGTVTNSITTNATILQQKLQCITVNSLAIYSKTKIILHSYDFEMSLFAMIDLALTEWQ